MYFEVVDPKFQSLSKLYNLIKVVKRKTFEKYRTLYQERRTLEDFRASLGIPNIFGSPGKEYRNTNRDTEWKLTRGWERTMTLRRGSNSECNFLLKQSLGRDERIYLFREEGDSLRR